MTPPIDTHENGWERWRGEMSSDLFAVRRDIERLLIAQSKYLEKCDHCHNEYELLNGEHKATRGLAWRGIVIATGAWAAIGTVATWFWLHATTITNAVAGK